MVGRRADTLAEESCEMLKCHPPARHVRQNKALHSHFSHLFRFLAALNETKKIYGISHISVAEFTNHIDKWTILICDTSYAGAIKLLNLADLGSRLGYCKEQNAFHVTESSQSDLVPDFFHGAHNISVPVNCGKEKLSSISEPWTHRWMGTASATTYGAWFKDPLPAPDSENKIYFVSNPTNQKSLYEYANYTDFISNRRRLVHTLTNAYGGTGFAVYNNSFYYSGSNLHFSTRSNLRRSPGLVRKFQWPTRMTMNACHAVDELFLFLRNSSLKCSQTFH
ncbi:PREDICTED: myocilin-like [Priapulus caudatus]|uniref:Myocilin-like n=1 Tax=Priapulus caudatus TaxID=37621 RepID=A0ABM1EFF4_PRICU|nr:PREDICTED: myocilin-like [Priapulus caudatus]